MYQFDDRFLESVGLSDMDGDQKAAFLDYAQEQFEIKVGEVMSARLSDEQLDEFDRIAEGDGATIQDWMSRYPDFANDADYIKISKKVNGEDEAKLNFVTKKWLDANCPEYDSLIKETLENFQKEIFAQRENIMAS